MQSESHSLPKLFLVLIVLVVIGLGLFALTPRAQAPQWEDTSRSHAESIRTGQAPIPILTEETKAKLAASTGFQALVSYTDNGFEPQEVTIETGETVRFTNNSSQDLWIAALGANVRIYPRTQDGCGPSDLDSCEPFAPQDFFEFTFERRGTWEIVNNLDKTRGGMVRVE